MDGKELCLQRGGLLLFLSYFCHIFGIIGGLCWPLMIYQRPFLKHKCDKNVTWENFSVTFLTHFQIGFCHILNTFLFFVSFLSDFEQFLLDFCHIFVFLKIIILSRSDYGLLSDFCQFFVKFCHIFVTFLKLGDLHCGRVPPRERVKGVRIIRIRAISR